MTAKTLAEELRRRADIWDGQVDTVVQGHVLARHVELLRQAADRLETLETQTYDEICRCDLDIPEFVCLRCTEKLLRRGKKP